MYTVFCKEAEQYQDLWKVMEELDASCWILEPENPSRRDTYRKISVGICLVNYFLQLSATLPTHRFFSIAHNVSLRIDVDPIHPRIFPSITWLGSEKAVFNLREKILDRVEVQQSISLNFLIR